MELKSVGVFSCGKIFGLLYALLGLIFGALFSFLAVLGLAANPSDGGTDAFMGLIFGIGAVIILPLFYGVMGFIGGLITAVLYNLVARIGGGLELEIEMPDLVAKQFD